jgi:hypothetical protein
MLSTRPFCRSAPTERGCIGLTGIMQHHLSHCWRDDFRRGFATRLMGNYPFILRMRAPDAAIRRSQQSVRNSALNVRTNHVHLLVAANERPERVMSTLKTWTTRDLREAGLAAPGQKVWARHGSTRYLWDEERTDAVWRYIVHGQHPEKLPGG